MTATIEPRDVTYRNLDQLLRLNVREDQAHLVAPNAVTIAEANYMPKGWMRGLWVGDDPVGLIAMIDMDADHPEVGDHLPGNIAYLWRLMIGASFQGKGYGRYALELAFDRARRWKRRSLYLSVAEGKGNALPFYRRFGFEPTGAVHGNELVLKSLISSA
ncbi:MAG: GNAT family N-acetyltransferase [Pseudomonadota bacterium]